MSEKAVAMPDVAQSSRECWRNFMRVGGIDAKHYDQSLVDDLIQRLNLAPGHDLGEQLAENDITVEAFLSAFLSVLTPYVGMLTDLLAMFERAEATASSTGTLHIAFDFGHRIEGLAFDLDAFRVWEWRWRNAVTASNATEPAWNYDYLKQLAAILDVPKAGGSAPDNGAAAWLSEYDRGRWPNVLPDLPRIPSGPIGESFLLMWQLWTRVVTAARALGDSRQTLRQYQWSARSRAVAGSGSAGLDPWLLKLLDGEQWAARMLRGIYREIAVPTRLAEIAESVRALIGAVPQRPRLFEEQVAVLEELLSLPIWSRRPELYSAWVGARIVAALGTETRVHAVNGLLRYAFSGTHLATAKKSDGLPIHLWAELRSPLAHPKGKGRKRSIQPDYSLQLEPVSYPECSILAVECKQYLQAQKGSFARALDDYARGRDKAKVILVNYGRAEESILHSVDPDVRLRTSIVGAFRPGSDSAIARFADLVRSTLIEHEHLHLEATPSVTETSTAETEHVAPRPQSETTLPNALWGQIRFQWGTAPTDLDLHVWIIDENGQRTEICYNNRGTLSSAPWAALDTDCRKGNGAETASLGRASSLRCAVYNFSNESPMRLSGGVLQVNLGGIRIVLECPRQGNGRWWAAFTYQLANSEIQVQGQLLDEPSA